ncbi:MAG: methionine biosynthesis protein MetW [Dehalococcoidia bacterium]|nr:MAG: methionine biosynthesis protein MetW [Dehalococcoidia bacterium]
MTHTGDSAVDRRAKREYQAIMDLIQDGSSVLDLGCGDGELLWLLVNRKRVKGRGIDISQQAIQRCVMRGLSVSQEDIERGLSEYGDRAFDYVILNQSLQQVMRLEEVLKEALRVGRRVIVGFPNFAYYRSRLQMFIGGRTPVTPSLPHMWYDTPNLHFLSIRDFVVYCRERRCTIDSAVFLSGERTVRLLPNLRAQTGVFLLSAGERTAPI